MLPCSNFAVVLCFLQVLYITADIDTSSFLIFNEDHNKCIKVETASSITLAACKPRAKEQQFRWASESRLLSLSLKLCLGATAIKDWVKVQLFECDENSDLQHWECKNDTIFGLRDQGLHLNWGNRNERNVMIYKGSGVWSRWKIYGTRGDLCSKGYQEIFTIGGNAFGSPCQFPFKFQEKWYPECTKDGRSDNQLWCATERDYDEVQKWGFCPTRASSSWETDPVTGVQYQLNAQSALTWYQARKSCQQQGADLLSIVELHEQSYISGLTNHLGSSLWIGLNSLDFDSGWQWSNGNPFRYLNWAPGHPSSETGLNCATLNAAKASKWESSTCTKKLGYICRKGNSTSLPPPPIKQPGFCPSHWVHYAGNCYYLERSTKMWRDALAACRKEGGDLASINNIEEQSFIISQSGYLPTDVLWIGLNDQGSQMLFEWSDHSHVTFIQWQSDEPSHLTNLQEDCVVIQGKDGKWADHRCEQVYGYICKKKASTKPLSGAIEQVNPGCKLGSFRFASYCYSIGEETKTFEEAKRVCSEAGANLVDVADRYENAFLVSLVGLRPEKYFWTGFSNTEDRNTFKWSTGRKVTFTHFNVGMPDRKQGCIAMTTGIVAGLWDVISCSNKEKYICKKSAEGLQTTTAPHTTLAPRCAPGWTPLATGNKCYKAYTKSQEHKKTWFEARDFCRAIGGDLISLHNRQEVRQVFHSGRVWIGFSLQGTNEGFVWSDGSPSDFEYWGYGEPNNHNDNEHCTEMETRFGWRWNDRHCEVYNNWICQILKGVTPKPEPAIVAQEYNTTEDGWLIYNDTQYYINMNKQSMEAARDYCKTNFGELAVITGDSERKFLWKQISKEKEGQYYIGMTVNLDKSFSWVDGTPVTYTAWEHNEPNFANNDENCVTMYQSMGYWNDINCGLELPSICKRSSSFINTTMTPTTVPKGGCAPEWLAFQGKCYKFVVGNDKNWHDARTYCINQGGNLLSVISEKEQAFLTTQMLNYKKDFWIGMNDVNWDMHFVWTDGKSISYTNWGLGEPASAPPIPPIGYFHESLDCVIMVGSITRKTGYWKVGDCVSNHSFICKRNTDSQIAVKPTTVLPKAFYKLGNDSYKVVAQKMRWDEARRQCQADDADLASILNPVTHAYVTLQMFKLNEPVWIGLNSNVTDFRFKWVDNWPLSFTKWGKNEPENNYGCVYIDVDKTWKTAPCTNTYYSLCKRSPVVPPTESPQLPGDCPESTKRRTWIPFRGHCYSFISSITYNWPHASVECVKMDASLVSIEDPTENKFIEENLEILQDSAKTFWIGMYKTNEDKWMWIDKSPVDYTNWEVGTQKIASYVYITSSSGQWNGFTGNIPMPFICKRPKDIKATEKPPSVAHVINNTKHGSAGITVFIVLIVIAIVGLGAFLLFRKYIPRIPRIPNPAHEESTFDNKLYVDNPFKVKVDTKGLVANIEENEEA